MNLESKQEVYMRLLTRTELALGTKEDSSGARSQAASFFPHPPHTHTITLCISLVTRLPLYIVAMGTGSGMWASYSFGTEETNVKEYVETFQHMPPQFPSSP